MSLAGLAACSAAAHTTPPPGATGTTCGTTRTGANVPVVIKVTKGSVTCATVMRIESGYAAAIRDGQLTGNGGGAPVKVSGWTCQGYPTPEVLRTGNASECHTATAEVVAVVELPSSSGS
jgi:hypothetical protein